MTRAGAGLLDSPVLAKDTLTRGRSWTTAAAVVGELCVLGGFAYAMFAVAYGPESLHGAVFATVALQLGITVLVSTSLAAGTIASERERGTLDLLLLGRLRPGAIVVAKFVASMSWAVLLVVSAVPVLLAVFLFAGVGFGALVAALVVTLAAALAVGALALLISARSGHTALALASSYAAVVALELGTALGGMVATVDVAGAPLVDRPADAHVLLFANPLYALYASVTPDWASGSHVGRLGQVLVGGDGSPSSWGAVVQPWHLAVAVHLVLVAVFLWGATRSIGAGRTSTPRRRSQPAAEPA